MFTKLRSIMVLMALVFALVSCQGLDSDQATAIFADCLRRNGVEAQDVVVTMSGDSVEGISVVIISEGNVPYEPALREACTEEVENK